MTYRVVDNGELPAEVIGTLTITVLPLNDPPRAVNDAYSVNENVVLNVAPPGVLNNDYHPDELPLTLQPQLAVSSQGVTVQVLADGSFSYDPAGKTVFRALNDGQTATDTFTYQIADLDGRTARGTVTITVIGINDPPHQNAANPADVSGDDLVSPLDALLVINVINNHGAGAIPAGTPADLFIDVNADGLLTAGDALGVVNFLNSASVGAESGEGEGAFTLPLPVEPSLPAAFPAVPPAGTAGDAGSERDWLRSNLAAPARRESVAARSDDWLRETQAAEGSPATAAVFDGLDADYPGVDDALDDLLLEVGTAAASEAATDELLGRLFG